MFHDALVSFAERRVIFMKRKIAKVLVMALLGLQLIGCSNQKKENTEEVKEIYFEDINADEYVTLGEYKGLQVVSNQKTITDEDVDGYIEYMLTLTPGEKEEITNRDVVANGDVANIDYVCKKDGVAFDGGTAEGYDLGIGSGSFIPGFEEGLVGVKVGETVDLELTFPETYPAADLAGAEVVFTVTVNSISKEIKPEFNDDFVAGLGIENVSTTEEYHAYLKKAMEESEKAYALQEMQTQLLTMATDNATVSGKPQELVDKFYQINMDNMTYEASAYGMDLMSYVNARFGLDEEGFETETVAAAEESAVQALVCLKIARDENIVVTEEDVKAAVENDYAVYGYPSVEEFKATVDMNKYKDNLLLNKVVDFLMENATITEVPEITE